MKTVYGDIKPQFGPYRAGFISISIIPKEWVDGDVIVDFSTNTVISAIAPLVGKNFFTLQFLQDTYQYEEKPKESKSGPYFEINIKGVINKISAQLQHKLSSSRYNEFIAICMDMDKNYRIVGNQDAGLQFSYDNAESSTRGGDQTVNIILSLQSEYPSPFYNV